MTPPKSQLIIFGGLPGVGKTTIAKNLAAKLQAVYLRIDTIEEALRQTAVKPEKKFTGPEGYVTAFAIAKDNLLNSCTVIADSVNPVEITRRQWRETATTAHASYTEVEIICSNQACHQRRIETRQADILGHTLPTWQEVLEREYDPWNTTQLVIDSSKNSVDAAVNQIMDHIGKLKREKA